MKVRKQIIINEIIYWKKNRMLPEHYCDFLLALYTKGNGLQDQSKNRFKKKYLIIIHTYSYWYIFILFY